jgi:capsular polysaccharide biosynthesis protein/GGDEF domain-containing protein
MILRNIIRTFQSSWRWVALFSLLGLFFSLIISLSTVPLYRSTVSFLIYPNTSLISSRDVVTSLDTLGTESVSKTYLEIFNSKRVFKDTVEKLELTPSIMTTYGVEAVVTTGSNIELSVSGPDPRMTAFLANNIGQNGINYIKSIYQVFDIAFLDQANEPTQPYSPRTLQNSLISLLIGLLFGLVFIFVRENLRAPLEALRRRALSENQSGAYILRHFRRLIELEITSNPAGSMAVALFELQGLDELMDVLPESVLSNMLHGLVRNFGNQLRGNDSVGRWNKSTFAILMPNTPHVGAERTLQRIKQILEDPISLGGERENILLAPCVGWTSRAKDETISELNDNLVQAMDIARASVNKIAEVSKTQAKESQP